MKRGAERNDKESDQNERHRGRNKVREHQEQPIHLASANTLSCHCERELVHSSDSLKHCRRGERGGREGGRQSEKWGRRLHCEMWERGRESEGWRWEGCNKAKKRTEQWRVTEVSCHYSCKERGVLVKTQLRGTGSGSLEHLDAQQSCSHRHKSPRAPSSSLSNTCSFLADSFSHCTRTHKHTPSHT